MYIWLITIGEPLPIDGSNERLYRTGILANLLVEKGHNVLWWASTFNHTKKKQRFKVDTLIKINERFKIKILYSMPYNKNISIMRVISHYAIAQKFKNISISEKSPDIILSSLPTIELCLAATEYGKSRNIPVVLDMRDMWPDIFIELIPKWGKWLAKLMLFPLFKKMSLACANATAISGITSGYVDWGLSYSGREYSPQDKAFPMGYCEVEPSQLHISQAYVFWEQHGLKKGTGDFIACFFGNMGQLHQTTFEMLFDAIQKLNRCNKRIRFVLCGDGVKYGAYKNLIKDCKNVIFPGWVGAAEIWTLMRLSSVGLLPYESRKDFIISLPNKSIEYLSAGLPILTTLEGILKKLLNSHDCGIVYENSDHLISILIDLYEHRDQLEVMSKNAYVLYKENFVAEKVYGKMIEYLEKVHEKYLKKEHNK